MPLPRGTKGSGRARNDALEPLRRAAVVGTGAPPALVHVRAIPSASTSASGRPNIYCAGRAAHPSGMRY